MIAGGRSTHNLIHPLVEYYTSRPDTPEEVIGYDEELLLGWIAERGFKLRGKYLRLMVWTGEVYQLSRHAGLRNITHIV